MKPPLANSTAPASVAGAGSPRPVWLAAALLVLAALGAYANSFRGAMVFDDFFAIRDNPSIRSLATGLAPPAIGGLPVSGRPVPNLSFALNYAAGGLAVGGYHAVNLAIHVCAGLVLFGLVRRTLLRPGPRERWGAAALPLAFFSALLWLVHPLATAAVTYLVERTESLMALFFLLTLYAFARSVEPEIADPAVKNGQGWRALAVVTCALGMASKEVMVAAPLLVLLYDRTWVSGSFAAAWRARRGFYLALASTWLLLGWLVLSTHGRGGTAGFATEISVPAYAATQAVALVRYLGLALVPYPLVFDYGAGVVTDAAAIVLCGALVLALAVATVIALRRWPAAGFFGATFFAILAPSSSVVPIATQTMAEHRMYLPLAIVVSAVVLAAWRWLGRTSFIGFAVLALVLGAATLQRNAVYASEISLWQDTLAKRPDNPRASCALGDALFSVDQTAAALPHYETAIRLKPDYPEAQGNYGAALVAVGRDAEAIPHLQISLRLRPDQGRMQHALASAFVHLDRAAEALPALAAAAQLRPQDATIQCDWGNALLRTGDVAGAVAHYETAIRLDPKFAMAHNNLANVLAHTGHAPEAIAQYEAALRLDPAAAEAHSNLASIYAATGRLPDAIQHYEAALRLRPDYATAHNNLANALALSDHLAEAVPHYEAAIRLRPDYAEAHRNLGQVLAALGRTAEAQTHLARAQQLDASSRRP